MLKEFKYIGILAGILIGVPFGSFISVAMGSSIESGIYTILLLLPFFMGLWIIIEYVGEIL